ncbi:thiamine phosphate synthase [Vibrio parahaemolyticus]|uniref:thiamine phosphate synthase n=1 Tax=Vibrio parahaemolyticus TaxID=670 RepID=UPI000812E854|nr:thiamine phosphate synthase [Vibrio parahaemolyticus]EGQ9456216.1 thiamine phosphate synthase [Vibrio parahaemolyticus]EJE4688044.1 thiamine phosphate synthase [Vibrio parahaemolyticus]EJE4692613.1 thiamine phosphate synthase [Vibrio parahaemolyticus]EJK2425354.1 thiamine phosphate synthase [Vibrio parahaemolyticus]OCP66629.1 thiamine-phosphate pyrophosphorylase [Vibrio parahaemolyticus]
MNAYRLYLVTDDQQDLSTLKHVVRKAVEGGVTMVQVREKHGDVRAFIERAQAVKTLLEGTGVPLIINDRVDVALAVDADGVHLGQSDMPAEIARQLIGPNKILGLSIETEDQLAEADSLPIDYIGLSAIFATPTKTNTKKYWGIEGLKVALNTTSLPIVAIGGINETNIPALSATGVHGLALVSAICHAENPTKAAEYLLSLMD